MLKYKIALINVWWNNNSEDTLHFSNIEEQTTYFNLLTSGKFSPLVNFKMGDNISTSVFVNDKSGRSPEELCRCNYAVVKKVSIENDIETEIERRYFYAKCSQDSNTQMFVQLDLDDIQTNYIYKDYRNILSGKFERTHLDRFKDNGDGTCSFKENGCIYEDENKIYEQRLVKREQLILKYDNNETLSRWLDTNVAYWVYLFVDPTHDYTVGSLSNFGSTDTIKGREFIYRLNAKNSLYQNSEIGVLFYPVFKNNNARILIQTRSSNYFGRVSSFGETDFRERNQNTSYYFTKKCSIMFKDTFSNYEISGNDLILKYNGNYDLSQKYLPLNTSCNAILVNPIIEGSSIPTEALLCGGISKAEALETLPISLDEDFTFTTTNIISNYPDTDLKYEPKINSKGIKALRLCTSDNSSFDYNIQWANKKQLVFLYNEAITPDITKYYVRLKSPSGIYISETKDNYYGNVGSTDNSIAVLNDQYSNFIANNKNYALQSVGQIGLTSLLGILGAVFAPTTAGASLAIGGTVLGATGQVISEISKVKNIENAPSSLKGTNGSFIFNANVMQPRIYVELYDCFECDRTSFFNYLQKYGYKYDEWGYLKDFDQTRHIYNYIKCNLDEVNSLFKDITALNFTTLSNEEFLRLKSIFSKGIRFWHSRAIGYPTNWANDLIPGKYNKENYEEALLNFS